MATLSIAQTIAYAKAAGFAGEALVDIVAIAMAESNLNTTVVNSIGATGILQIYLAVHPDVTSAQAKDPAFSFRYAYKLSSGGTNLCAWQSYSSDMCGIGWDNRWAQFVPQVRTAIGNASTSKTQLPTNGTQWWQFPINTLNDYATAFKGPGTDTPHYAVDIEASQDTPFYFLQPGKITKADYQPWGGEVFEQPDSGGQQEYVYHLDQIQTTVGAHVNAGQVVGLSGGQTSGGSHPTSPQYSTGPHIHFGFFQKYIDSQNGVIPFGQDPNTILNQAKAGELTNVAAGTGTETATLSENTSTTKSTPTPLSIYVNEALSKFPGFEGIAIALDLAEEFPGIIWYNVNSSTRVPQVPSWVPGAGAINTVDNAVFDAQDYIGAGIRSILDTIGSNTPPLLFRGMLVITGLLLVGGLVANAVSSSGIMSSLAEGAG